MNKLKYFQNSLYFLPQYYHMKVPSCFGTEMSNLDMDVLLLVTVFVFAERQTR